MHGLSTEANGPITQREECRIGVVLEITTEGRRSTSRSDAGPLCRARQDEELASRA